MSGERREKASEQRKKKSRERGEGVRSRELTSAAGLLGGLLLLRGASTEFIRVWTSTYVAALGNGVHRFDSDAGLVQALPGMLLPAVAPLAAVLAASFFAAVSVGCMQNGGLQFHPAVLAWKPGRLSPGSGVKNLFSGRSVLRFFKSLLPAAAIILLAASALKSTVMPMTMHSTARLPVTFAAAYTLAMHAAWISLAWAALDFANEWRQWNRGLRMSKEEVKQEMKESDGNPLVKGRIRQMRRAVRKRRVRTEVSRAAVVITSPTPYPVALLFEFEDMGTPRLLRKGRDLHALQIREHARWAGVPVVENPQLARSLFRSVDEGHAIPQELYAAVANILACLFHESAERAKREAQRPARRGYGSAAPPPTVLPFAEQQPRQPNGQRFP